MGDQSCGRAVRRLPHSLYRQSQRDTGGKQRYQNYVPPGAPGVLPPACTNQGSRNHDVFHAFVDARVAVNAIATFKQLSGSVDRGFPITVTNGTSTNAAGQPGNRFFRLSFDKPEIASFDQFDTGMDVFDVELLPFSSSTRVAYVTAQNPSEAVKVFVVETTGLPATPGGAVTTVPNGLSGSVTLNLDPTNDADPGNTNGTVNEDHTPLVSNPLVSNHGATPLVSNAALNPLVSNPLVSNNALNPLVSNPLVSNGSLPDGTPVYNITDTTWKVASNSNVASALSAAVNVANAQSLEGTFVFQLLIHKTSTSAGSVGWYGRQCRPGSDHLEHSEPTGQQPARQQPAREQSGAEPAGQQRDLCARAPRRE